MAEAEPEEPTGNGTLSVEIEHAYGSQTATRLRDGVFFGDDAGHYLVYPVGAHVAYRHYDTGEMAFIMQADGVTNITACAISRDQAFLAVAAKTEGEQPLQVTVYDMKAVGVKPLKQMDILALSGGSKDGPCSVPCLNFSYDTRSLCVVTEAPNPSLNVLDWHKRKSLGSFALPKPVTRATFSPLDSLQVCVSGDRFCRLLRLRDHQFKLFPRFQGMIEDDLHITDHCWAMPGDHTLVCTTLEGQAYILNCETLVVVREISDPFPGKHLGVHTVVPHSQGFVFGGADGYVAVWERTDEFEGNKVSDLAGASKDYRVVRALYAGRKHPVTSLSVSDTEESVVAAFADADIGVLSMANFYMVTGDTEPATFLSQGFHASEVTGLGMAVQRPLAVSCSTDGSVRVWNYANKGCELARVFVGDTPQACAMHPNGYMVAVAFTEKLRIFSLLVSEFKVFRDFAVRGIKTLRFAPGGQHLAAAHGKVVVVYDTVRMEKVASLRAHSDTVTVLAWAADSTLCTCGADGTVYEWQGNTWQRHGEHTSRSVYTCAAYDQDNRLCAGATEGGKSFLRVFKDCLEPKQDLEMPKGVHLTSLVHYPVKGAAGFLLCATSTGAVWVYPCPLEQHAFDEYALHSGPIGHMLLSVDCRALVTAGVDGSVFLLALHLELPEEHKGGDERDACLAMEAKMADVVMVHRADYQKHLDQIELLGNDLTMLRSEKDQQVENIKRDFVKTQQQARLADQDEIQQMKKRYDALTQTANAKERDHLRIIKSLEASHCAAADELEGLYEKKIAHEADRYHELDTEKKRLEQMVDEVKQELAGSNERERKALQQECQAQLDEKQLEIEKLKDMIAYLEHRYEAMLGMEEKEHELELDKKRVLAEQELKAQKQQTSQLKKEQDALLRGLEMMGRDKEQVAKEMAESESAIKQLRGECDELKRQVYDLQKERLLQEKNSTQQEKRIMDYKQKVSTLKKFKHVLDFRLREVSESLMPKERQIEQLKAQLSDLDLEFEKQLKIERSLTAQLEQRTQKIQTLQQEAKKAQEQLEQKDKYIDAFTRELHELVHYPEQREWPGKIKELYRKHVRKERTSTTKDTTGVEEITRQMGLMEKKIGSFAIKSERAELACKVDTQRKAMENSLLIHELNELRVEKKHLQSKLRNLELANKQLQLKQQPQKAATQELATTAESIEPVDKPRVGRAASVGRLRRGPTAGSHMSAEEREKMQNLLQQVDLTQQQNAMQKLEIKVLRDQVGKLVEERRSLLGDVSPLLRDGASEEELGGTRLL